MYRKLFLLLALALPLVGQESAKPFNGDVLASPKDIEMQLKARIAYLEQRLALTEQKCTALANFYAAQQALDQQKPPNPIASSPAPSADAGK